MTMLGVNHLNEKHLHVVLCIGGVVICTKISYDIIIKLSMSGKSKNRVIKFFHSKLRPYLNCGILIRREFFVKLSSYPICLTKKSYVIVNYGSYGTVPVKVHQYQFNVQKELEYCPDLFNRLTLRESYEASRLTVAKAVGCEPDNLVFVENLTEAITCSLRSLFNCLKRNDAVLCLRSFAYGAVVKAIDVLANEYHIDVVDLDLQFPIFSKNDISIRFEEIFLNYPSVKIAVFDHITSASSVVMPIKELGEICRKYNVISIVDGAHAPGQLFLNIDSYNVDVYLGNLHKWYYTPKSCAIMCVNKKWHDKMQPSWISHAAYRSFQDKFFMQGTKNYSAMVSAGYAVDEFTECIGGLHHLHSYIPPLIDWVVQLYISKWETEEVQIPGELTIKSINVEETSDFKLNCNLDSKTNASLIWKKDDVIIQENATNYLVNGISLIIKKANYFDRGLYECASLSNNKTSEKFFLRVKNPHRAVWPTIGLLLQVIIVATIIFFSEKQKSKNVPSVRFSEEERLIVG